MLDNFNFDGEGVYYIFFADFPDYCLSIENNNLKLNVSLFQDSFYQSFYIFENEDNSYYIMNLNSLKILGVNFNLTVTQNDIKPLKQNKWEITKNGYFNNYYIDNTFWNKRLDCNNEYFIINEKNDYSKTQKFLFKKCIYNITKSDIWNKWEIHLLREFTDNQLYINIEIKELKVNKSVNPFLNVKIHCLILREEISKIESGFFDNSYFDIIICEIEHIKYLNKNGVSKIVLPNKKKKIINSYTFQDFSELEFVILHNNLKKIESKAFINCKKLKYLEIPDSCIDIRWDSFYDCNNLQIKCNDSIKEKLKRNVI